MKVKHWFLSALIVVLQTPFTPTAQAIETYHLTTVEKTHFVEVEGSLSPVDLQKISTEVSKPFLKTGKSPYTAVGLSALWPGAGQFYNGDPVVGGLFSLLAAIFIISDNFVPGMGLIGYPGMNIISAALAGANTPTEIPLETSL